MAVIVYCEKPSELIAAVKTAIGEGRIDTWRFDDDGDFTHAPDQWRLKAWLRPNVADDRVTFWILSPKGVQMSRLVYAIYHGRFIEMLLGHFDKSFSRAVATALPVQGDRVAGQ